MAGHIYIYIYGTIDDNKLSDAYHSHVKSFFENVFIAYCSIYTF